MEAATLPGRRHTEWEGVRAELKVDSGCASQGTGHNLRKPWTGLAQHVRRRHPGAAGPWGSSLLKGPLLWSTAPAR